MRLSERLEAVLAVELSYPSMDSLIAEEKRNELLGVLGEAISLAKRYEDAPVGFVMGQGLLTQGAAAIVQTEKPGDVKGQRARIVLDKEG